MMKRAARSVDREGMARSAAGEFDRTALSMPLLDGTSRCHFSMEPLDATPSVDPFDDPIRDGRATSTPEELQTTGPTLRV